MRDRYLDVQKHDGLRIMDVIFNPDDCVQYSLVAKTQTLFSVQWRRANISKLYRYCLSLDKKLSDLNSGQLAYANCLILDSFGFKDFSSSKNAQEYFRSCCMRQGALF